MHTLVAVGPEKLCRKFSSFKNWKKQINNEQKIFQSYFTAYSFIDARRDYKYIEESKLSLVIS